MKKHKTRKVMLLAASVMMCTLAFGSGAFAEDLPNEQLQQFQDNAGENDAGEEDLTAAQEGMNLQAPQGDTVVMAAPAPNASTEEADQAAADAVIAEITALNSVKVDYSAETKILTARNHYETLTDAQKQLIGPAYTQILSTKESELALFKAGTLHNWVQVTETITIIDTPAWDEKIPNYKNEYYDACSTCGLELKSMEEVSAHFKETGYTHGSWGTRVRQVLIGYITVHHDAVTHTEKRTKIVCSDCGEEKALDEEPAHIHTWTPKTEMGTVVDKPAWTESVPITEEVEVFVCTCGKRFNTMRAWEAHFMESSCPYQFTKETETIITGYTTIQHPAITHQEPQIVAFVCSECGTEVSTGAAALNDPDTTAAASVTTQITNLKDVGILASDEAAVKAARDAYNNLSPAQKKLISAEDLQKLLDAEKAIAEMKAGGDTTSRVFGANRYATSVETAEAYKKQLGVEKFDTVIVAFGGAFPDALSASYLAVANKAPILLIAGNKGHATFEMIISYIKANLKSGGKVYIVGGTGVVSSDTERALTGYNLKRLAGANRYETNLAVLRETGVTTGTAYGNTYFELIVASGGVYADALSGSSVGKAILLAREKVLDKQAAFLAELKKKHGDGMIYILGGTGSVSRTVENQLKSYGNTSRYGGSNRYETSRLVADAFYDGQINTAVYAYGVEFADGLCAGPLANELHAPILLTANAECFYRAAALYVKKAQPAAHVVLGGRTLVSNGTINKVSLDKRVDTVSHKDVWLPYYKTVTEKVIDEAAWTEQKPVYVVKMFNKCAACGELDPTSEHIEQHSLAGDPGGGRTYIVWLRVIDHYETIYHAEKSHMVTKRIVAFYYCACGKVKAA